MSFRFDARAALAEIKRRRPLAAPTAVPAIEASPVNGAGATVADVTTADVEEFEERAAIAEYDLGLSRAEAEAAAAQAQGYADPATLRSAAALVD